MAWRGGSQQNAGMIFQEPIMNSSAPTPPDSLTQYIDNVTCLSQRVRSLQQKQRQALAELLLIRERCQALRQALSA